MAVKHQTVTLSTTATDLTAEVDNDTKAGNTRTLRVENLGTGIAYLGGPDVTSTSYGQSLAANAVATFTLDGEEKIYAVLAAATTGSVRLLHFGL